LSGNDKKAESLFLAGLTKIFDTPNMHILDLVG
jgi:hypothetical protein